jgi:hypothetical protein
MNTPRPPQDGAPSRDEPQGTRDPASIQPPATGANRGSPAAPVMREFSKTEAESGGTPDDEATTDTP